MTEVRAPEAPGTARSNRKRKAQIHAEPVEVYCRLKPIASKDPADLCCVAADNASIRLYNPDDLLKPSAKESHFTFTKVYDQNIAQQEIYANTAVKLVDDLIQGKNGLLFAYGVTSSGKTHTVTGTPEQPGILPRSIDTVFNSIRDLQTPKYIFKPDHVNTFDIQSEAAAIEEARMKDIASNVKSGRRDRNEWLTGNRVHDQTTVPIIENNLYAIFVSYIEVYNENIVDLLDDQSFDNASCGRGPQTKKLKCSFDGSYFVSGLEEVEIKSANEAFDLLWKGQQRRHKAQTILNESSSRSHSVFSFRIVQAPRYAVEAAIAERRSSDVNTCPTFTKHSLWISQLSIVDLAGSERSHRTQNRGERLREGCGINQSLMTLRMCLEKLRSNQMNGQSEVVSYKDSKLTTMFKNFFEGIGSVRMIVCVNPGANEFRENAHVLKFAELSQEVQVFHTSITAKAAAQLIPPPPPPPPPAQHQPITVPPPLPRNRGEHNGGRGDAEIARRAHRSSRKAKRSRSRSPAVREIQYPVIPFPLSMDIPAPEDPNYPDEVAIQLLRESILNRRSKLEELRKETNSRFDSCRSSLSTTYQKFYEATRESADCRSEVGQRDSEVKAARDTVASLQSQMAHMTREIRRLKMENSNLERINRHHAYETASTASSVTSQTSSTASPLPPFRSGAVPRSTIKTGRTVQAQAIVHQNPHMSTAKKPRVPPQQTAVMSPSFARANSNPDVSISRAPPDRAVRQGQAGRNAVPAKPRRVNVEQPATNIGVAIQPAVANGPVVGHLRQRRSKSAERWLEHDAHGIMKLDTVMQPSLAGKKRKSVTELTLGDTKAADKYILRTQTRDRTSGDLTEKLYKGDVVPTTSGGAAVILTEVEELHIASPRHSVSASQLTAHGGAAGAPSSVSTTAIASTTPLPSALASPGRKQKRISPACVEERCAVGIAGRDGFKKNILSHNNHVHHQSPFKC